MSNSPLTLLGYSRPIIALCYNFDVVVVSGKLMRNLMVHTLLAILMLIQSVSALAMVPFAPASESMPVEAVAGNEFLSPVELSQYDQQQPCHGQRSDTEEESPQSCCETMDEAGCILGCSLIATAISCLSIHHKIDVHISYALSLLHTAPFRPLTGLYRPPWIG